MAIFKTSHPPPPSTNAAADAVEQDVQVIEAATTEKQHVVDDKAKKQPGGLSNYFRVFTYGTKLDFFLLLLSCLTSIGSGAAFPLMNVVLGQLVGDFTGYFVPNSGVDRDEFQASVNKNALLFVYIFIGRFALSYISMVGQWSNPVSTFRLHRGQFSVRISGLRISAAMRLAYLRATFAQPISVLDTVSPGKVSTRITTSSNTIQIAISQHFAMLFQQTAFIIGLYVVAFIKSWSLTLVASAALPFILITYGSIVGPFIKLHKVTEKIHEEASALAFEIFSSIRVVIAFGAQAKLTGQHEQILDNATEVQKKEAPLFGLLMFPSMFAMYGTFGIAFWFGIRQFSRGNLNDIGDLVVVLFSVMMAVMNVGRLASPVIAVSKANVAAGVLFKTIDAPTPDTSGLKDPEVSADATISLENVAFSYPSRPNVQVLGQGQDGLSITFESGKTTAIVGPSGSGKSSVVSLLMRFYDLLQTTADTSVKDKTKDTIAVDAKTENGKKDVKDKDKDEDKEPEPNTCTGAVKIGNTDLQAVDLKWWRTQIGLVQQEPFLFNASIFDNIAFGLCGTQWQDASKEEKMKLVEDACNEAYATEFIDKLPQGYETLVGESGIKLSGGQRQRLAIARSIIKQPTILILDEATSAIDVRSERIVQQALDRVSKDRTTIVIAHRLSTIKRAHKIVVLRQGKLVEQGSHEELLRDDSSVYFGLVHAQNLAMEAEEEEEDLSIQKTKTGATEHSEANPKDEEMGITAEDPKYEKKGLIGSFGRLLFEQRHHWVLYSVEVLGILCAGAVYPLQAYIFANVIQVFTYVETDMSRFVREGNFWSGMFGVEAAAVGIAYFAMGVASHLISIAITRHYRQEYLVNMLSKRVPYFDAEGHSAGSLSSSLSADTEQLQQLMSTEMSFALIAVVNMLGSIIISFVYGWKLTLVSLVASVPPILVAGYVRFRLEMKFEEMNAAIFANSSQFASEAVGSMRTVLSLTLEQTIGDRYQTLLQGQVRHAFGTAKFGTIIFAASDSVEFACMALTFWYGGTLLASREYDLVDFFIIYMAVVQGAVAAGMWFSFAPNMAQASGAANRILSLRPSTTAPPPKYDDIAPMPHGASIDFRNVYFTYQSREIPVLSNLNFSIQPGQFAALVGSSGCGKSTTISLLERFYDTDSGTISVNNQPIASLDPAEYRKHVSLVSQEPTLYEGTIRDNVALSVDAESVTDDAIHAACTDAQIHDFIVSLPDGYNTRLGPKGMSLSGGQKQRLSLARALLRHPKLLLLDEATSSLDSESEKLVQAAIERAAGEGGRTVLAVAHRLATIQKADVIFVLGSGKVLEKGSHQELLRARGVYWQMCQAQALDR
ncbi:leptomycin B resistance protein pmd1 [Polyplosphaeria fusca]|uniref:Leptomycin B resistance protein pmd1 n=1 Tax=Polyplosphaeria fusca TaxID=682080 RepID=A0A9P4V0J6_9PLEO|nr:leptomycin B resistance protein pmd1 [Polyplosphaeria fusca]